MNLEHLDWPRCRGWIAASAAFSPLADTIEQIEGKLADGRLQLWPGENSAAVTQIASFDGRKAMIIRYGGGDLDEQRVADNQSATAAKAFGGSRQGVADSLTNEAYLRNVSSTTANLRSSAFDRAVDAATADLDRLLGASQFNSGRAYDAQKTNVGNRLTADQFNAGMALDVARTNVANDMAGAGFRLNAANALAGLSDQELNAELKRAGALGLVGDTQQQNQQARDDAAYEEFMRMIGYPAQQQAMRNQALGMMPIEQTTTTTSSQKPGFLDYVNSAAGLVKAFKPGG